MLLTEPYSGPKAVVSRWTGGVPQEWTESAPAAE